MNTTQQRILKILKKEALKPGILCKKLGISRQALHRHLQKLMMEKSIQKHGEGPHVVYAIASINVVSHTRVRTDYVFCKKILLPQYVHDYAQIISAQSKSITTKKNSVDFGFLIDSAAVYSSNIEGNSLNLNSFLNSKMAAKKHRPKEAQEIEDLVMAYEYGSSNILTEQHMLHAHKILTTQFVVPSRQGCYRQEPVGVFSQNGLEYMAVEAQYVQQEMDALYTIVSELLSVSHSTAEYFFWAAWIHLMVAMIHPFSDGNGRTARLCEKWFLKHGIGQQAFAIQSEHQYWNHRSEYYAALRLGANYWEVDIRASFPFFSLLPECWKAQ